MTSFFRTRAPMSMSSRARARAGARMLAAVVVVLAAVTGCSTAEPDPPADRAPSQVSSVSASISVPPQNGRFSYQIGGAFTPPAGVSILARDHTDRAEPDVFSICYINAFQAQPDAVDWWTQHHPDLLLRDSSGALIVDEEWDEPLLDISSTTKRAELLEVVGEWVDGCATRGFRAVEADNLDSYTRSKGTLTVDDAMAFSRLLVERSHRNTLGIGQKNAADLANEAKAVGFDFAIAEECEVYAECDDYTAAYGNQLIEIEYTDQPMAAFTTACRERGTVVSVVLRDRDVSPSGDVHHVERWCS